MKSHISTSSRPPSRDPYAVSLMLCRALVASSALRRATPGIMGPGSRPGRRKLKPRRALFGERLDAFLDLDAAHAVAGAEGGGFLVAVSAGRLIYGALSA